MKTATKRKLKTLAALALVSCSRLPDAQAQRPPLPGGHYQPFAANSPFNTPLPPHPRLDPNSDQIIDTLNSMVNNVWGMPPGQTGWVLRAAATPSNYDFTYPFYYSIDSDPVYKILCRYGSSSIWQYCGLYNLEIHIPSYAEPEHSGPGKHCWDTDHHMAIIDSTTGVEYDMWGACQPDGKGGNLVIGWGGYGHIWGQNRDQGISTETISYGAEQSGFGLTIGIVRTADIHAGIIPHALQMAIPCASDGVYPAAVPSDQYCPSGTTNPPYYGMRVQLNLTDHEIHALDVPAYAKAVLLALAHYGAFICDTGTGNEMELKTESGLTYTKLGLSDPWVALANQYRIQPAVPGDPYNAYLFPVAAAGLTQYLRVIDPCVTAGTC
jgi:hypothetical protein